MIYYLLDLSFDKFMEKRSKKTMMDFALYFHKSHASFYT